MLIFGLTGLIVSIYLFQDYFLKDDGYLCEVTSFFSCSLARDSPYSVLFGVPLGAWGALWFVIFLSFVYFEFKEKLWSKAMLIWSACGILFVAYFVRAEILIGSICPYCSITHLMVIVLFMLSIVLYRKLYVR
jgi:uncharacterized membrane protein